jgi:hypothetical protein
MADVEQANGIYRLRIMNARIITALVLFSGSLFAQWPAYRAPGAPRTGRSANSMNAAPPKASNGKPDLSGVWDATPVVGGSAGIGGPAGAPSPLFRNLDAGVPGGMPLLPWAAQLRRERGATASADHPDAHCLPVHPVQLHSHPQPRKMIQTPGVVVIIYEANNGLRQIFTDGRPLPSTLPKSDPQPWWYGYSVGKWQGDTLVVETNGFRDDQWLDEAGTPMTANGKMIERFRRPDFGTLEIDMTLEDDKTFTKPVNLKITQHLMPDAELIEFVCQENEKSVRHFR